MQVLPHISGLYLMLFVILVHKHHSCVGILVVFLLWEMYGWIYSLLSWEPETRPGLRKTPNTPILIKDCNNGMIPKGILLTHKSDAFRTDYFWSTHCTLHSHVFLYLLPSTSGVGELGTLTINFLSSWHTESYEKGGRNIGGAREEKKHQEKKALKSIRIDVHPKSQRLGKI